MTLRFSILNLGSEPIIFEGRTLGTIVPSRGPKVFGWDAIFEPEGYNMTYVLFESSLIDLQRRGSIYYRYAEMPSDIKNKISHRGKALEKLKAYLQGLA